MSACQNMLITTITGRRSFENSAKSVTTSIQKIDAEMGISDINVDVDIHRANFCLPPQAITEIHDIFYPKQKSPDENIVNSYDCNPPQRRMEVLSQNPTNTIPSHAKRSSPDYILNRYDTLYRNISENKIEFLRHHIPYNI